MGDRELKVVAAAFVLFCCFAGGVVVYVLRMDSAKSQVAKADSPVSVTEPSPTPEPKRVAEPEPESVAELEPEPQPEPEPVVPEQPPKPAYEVHVDNLCTDMNLTAEERAAGEALIKGGIADWAAASTNEKLVCSVTIAARLNPSETYMRVLLIGGLVNRFLDATTEILPNDTIGSTAATYLVIAEKEIAAELPRMESDTRKRLAGKVIDCKILRVEKEEIGVILHVEVRNNSKAMVEFLRLQCVLRGFTGDYIDTEDKLIERIPPSDSVIIKIRTDVHPERYSKAVFSIVGTHASEFLLTQ